jgi:hypothetical protein
MTNVLRSARLLQSRPVQPRQESLNRFELAIRFFPGKRLRLGGQIREAGRRALVRIPQPVRPSGAIFAFQHLRHGGGIAEDAFRTGDKHYLTNVILTIVKTSARPCQGHNIHDALAKHFGCQSTLDFTNVFPVHR